MNRVLAFCSACTAWYRAHPKKVLCAAGVSILLIGGYVVYAQWQDRQQRTLEFAVSQINLALATKDMALLERFVEFDPLSKSFAAVMNKNAELAKLADVADIIGVDLVSEGREGKVHELVMSVFAQKEGDKEKKETGSAPPPSQKFLDFLEYSGPVLENLRGPSVFPADFIAQLLQKPFAIQGKEGNWGILSTTINHPVAGYTVPLRLLACNTPEGWRVREVANAAELVTLQARSLKKYADYRESVFHSFNARIREVMNAHCFIVLCDVVVNGIQPEESTVKLIVNLEGTNIGNHGLLSAGIRVELYDDQGHFLHEFPIGINNKIPTGASFRQHWNLEPTFSPEAMAYVKNLKRFKTRWSLTSVSLDNRLFVFPKPIADLKIPPKPKATTGNKP